MLRKLENGLRVLFRKEQLELAIDDELRFHLDKLTAEKVDAGMSLQEARRRARIELGGVEQVKEKVREVRWGTILETFWQDIRYGARMLRRNPGFTIVAVLTLALGIGASTAIFSVVQGVLLRSLPYPEPERLVMLWREAGHRYWLATPEYFDYRERQRTLEDFAVYRTSGGNLTGRGEVLRVNIANVSVGFFPVLGVQPLLGRTFTEDEDLPGNNRVIVLEHGFWQRRFGGDPSVVGETLTLDDQNYTVVGVMPAGVGFPGDMAGAWAGSGVLNANVDLWTPLALDPANPGSRGAHIILSLARMKSGTGLELATQDVLRITSDLQREYPDSYPEQFRDFQVLQLRSLHESLVGEVRPALLILLGAVVCVLLIACANVANLLLGRASSREKEIALRAALGAGQVRLIRQLLTEHMLLSFLGGLLGLLFALWGVDALIQLGPQNLPRLQEVGIDTRVLGFAFGLTVLTGVLFGLAPALRTSRAELTESLKEGGRSSGAPGRHRLRNVLVVGELAVSLVLLIGAGLLLKSFTVLLQVDPGFRTENVLSFRLALPQAKYAQADVRTAFYQQLLAGVEALPGVQSAGAISYLPLATSGGSSALMPEGMPRNFPQYPIPYGLVDAHWRVATPGYFRVMGITLVQGRFLTSSDTAEALRAVVVDENLARRAWPGEEYIVGKRLAFPRRGAEQDWWTVVGVVRHTRHIRLERQDTLQAYFPLAQSPSRLSMHVVLKTMSDPGSVLSAVRNEVGSLDAALPLFDVEMMDRRLAQSMAQPRFNVLLMGLFAALALILGAVGLYGVISYSVSQRTHEIGIRMALGARRGAILRMVVGQGMLLSIVGAVLGLAGGVALTRYLESLLFGVASTDILTFSAVPALLLTVALLACYVPARRATKVDPMVALRYE